jgi:hypothetical protein
MNASPFAARGLFLEARSTASLKVALCLGASSSQPFAKDTTMNKIIAALIAATFSMGAFAQAASAPAAAPAAKEAKPAAAKAEKKAKAKKAKAAKKAASAA